MIKTGAEHSASTDRSRCEALLQLALFIAIGGSAALVYALFSAAMIGMRTGLPDWLVSGLCYAIMVPLVYLLHHLISFRSASGHRQALPRYLAVQALGICLATLLSLLCHTWLRLPPVAAGLVIAAVVAGINFLLLKLWAFTAPAEVLHS
jgi:putative flippase GtrA